MSGPSFPTRPRLRPSLVRLSFLFLATLPLALPCLAASRPPVRASNGMAVTPDEQATRAALDVLRAGGNAVDAAVATAFALAVALPHAGNLGGGGLLLYRSAESGVAALDFRETAPAALRPELFLDEDGRAVPERSRRGGLAVGVPGTVAGLAEAHRRWGRLPWAALLAPALRLADEGSVVSPWLAGVFAESGTPLVEDSAARAIFAPSGILPQAGSRIVQRDLAATLRRIAEQGAAGFYRGSTADAIVDSVRAAGGALDAADLARYTPLLRTPLEGTYRGYRVVSFPPPSSGGIGLLQMLGMLERFDLSRSGAGSSMTVHLMAEVERRFHADRARWLGDPAFFAVPQTGLLDPAYLAKRAASILLDRATPSAQVDPGHPPQPQPGETLHFSIADRWGGAVALTTTLNGAFGCGRVAAGTGVLLNNQIDDFALAPGSPNLWGLTGDEANRVAPDKRPLSSMSPTIVELPERGPRPALVLGSPGGSHITTSVLQVLVNVIDHGMGLQEAVDYPRFHHPWLPDAITHETNAFPADVARALEVRGHRLQPARQPLGNVNAIGIDGSGRWTGAADPRREGSAGGY